jgi:hypothetical protein
MSKKLNITAIQNELSGGSAFFPGYENNRKPVTPPAKKPASAKTVTPVLPGREVLPVPPVPPVRGDKRVMRSRHPFDIYEDQYQSLKALSLQERMQGGVGSMSAMVREAIDTFIEKRRTK